MDFRVILEKMEKIINSTSSEEINTWIPSYRKYEQATDEPLNLFEWILLNYDREK